jgi:septal ring factor EnvC (AmiA/AmiB activator)
MPSNNSKLTASQARAAARKRTLATLETRRAEEREKLERRLAAEVRVMEANEANIAEFLQADSELAAAEAELRVITERSAKAKATALAAIAERVGSVSGAADLVEISAAKAKSLLREAGLSVGTKKAASSQESTPAPATPDAATDESRTEPSDPAVMSA